MLKNLLTFSKTERNGTIVLITIIILLLVTLITYNSIGNQPSKSDFKEFDKEISEFEASLIPKTEQEELNRLDKYIVERYDSLDLFAFNPNYTTEEEWKKLGLTAKQIKTINTYLSRGGKFFEKDDFRKIYGIRAKQYQILEPYLQLPEHADNTAYYKNEYENKNNTQELKNSQLYSFNPNTATSEDWKNLGMSEKQINIIQNFTSKGGKFKTKQDFKKIYGITDEQYIKLDPYIELPDVLEDVKLNKDDNFVFELNSVTPGELKKIDGITDFHANSIIKYRNALGGYVKVEQLREVYGMTDEIYNLLAKHLKVDAGKIMKISLNFAEKEEFSRHPYLEYKEAKAIVEYRTNNGAYKNLETLLSKKVVSEYTYSKIKDYLAL